MHLQYLNALLRKQGDLKRSDLNLIGKDCRELDKKMRGILEKLQRQLPAEQGKVMTPLIAMWSCWMEASWYLWLEKCTPAQARACRSVQENFFQQLVSLFDPADMTWY